jgi:hypothetical protein
MNGPGLSVKEVLQFFAVERPLLSTKLKRLPLRGMLGNGLRVVMGAVAAFGGSISVETRGHRLTLGVDRTTGKTDLLQNEAVERRAGLVVCLNLSAIGCSDNILAQSSIRIAGYGKPYRGHSSSWWYGVSDLERLFHCVTPEDTSVTDVCRDLGLDHHDDRVARSLPRLEIAKLLRELQKKEKPIDPKLLGSIGQNLLPNWPGYSIKTGTYQAQSGAHIPYIVEAWVECTRAETKGQGSAAVKIYINRSCTLAPMTGASYSRLLRLQGCGIDRQIDGPGTGNYTIVISVISPFVQLATDGKEPELKPFGEAIANVVGKACGQAHRAMERPNKECTLKEAAWAYMKTAYLSASGNGHYPATARQVMYAARPKVLERTGRDTFGDSYFIQDLIRPYLAEHPEETANWDVVFDARGHFTEPHTTKEVALGTIAVREYLDEAVEIGDAVRLEENTMYPTVGPENRFSAVLFIEKEGFDSLLAAAQIAQRFDIAIMSTKGMSVAAARRLIDGLSARGVKILVAHDFDVTGFKIFGTLGTDSKVYTFENEIEIIDIGLSLHDVRRLQLIDEPVEIKGERESHAETLSRHGASPEEIEFLLGDENDDDPKPRRVELNMMTAPVFIKFLEDKFAEHGVKKIVPDVTVLEAHARRIIEQQIAQKILEQAMPDIQSQSAAKTLPSNLEKRVKARLKKSPELSWDMALAEIIRET